MTTISFSQRVSVPHETLVNVVDNESVILSLKSERYFGLDEVGTRMWAALTTSESIQAAYDKLLAEFDVDAEVLRRDLTELVTKLLEHELLVVVGG